MRDVNRGEENEKEEGICNMQAVFIFFFVLHANKKNSVAVVYLPSHSVPKKVCYFQAKTNHRVYDYFLKKGANSYEVVKIFCHYKICGTLPRANKIKGVCVLVFEGVCLCGRQAARDHRRGGTPTAARTRLGVSAARETSKKYAPPPPSSLWHVGTCECESGQTFREPAFLGVNIARGREEFRWRTGGKMRRGKSMGNPVL